MTGSSGTSHPRTRRRFKQEFGATNGEIADAYGQSRQWVDNQILIATLPTDIQNRINDGKLSASAALTEYKEGKKKAKQQTEIPGEDADIFPFDALPVKKEVIDDEDLFVPDNSISSPSTRLKEDKSSNEHVYNEPEEKIWERALRQISAHTEQDKSISFIVGELRAVFVIQNRK